MGDSRVNLITVNLAAGNSVNVPEGITLAELSKDLQHLHKAKIMAAKVDNDIRELGYRLLNSCQVEFIDMTNDDGLRIYRRSLHFIMIKAAYDLFPDEDVMISHSISKGIFCRLKGNRELTADEVKRLEDRMKEIVNTKIPFVKRVVTVEEAREIFTKSGRLDRFHAIEHRKKPYATLYSCGGLDDYFYGYMAPDTGYIDKFELIHYPPGFILIAPEKSNPGALPEFNEQKKLFSIFTEYKRWVKVMGVQNVGALNDIVKSGRAGELIRVTEALQEKKIAQIADMIAYNHNKKKVVLISGPSSSGKTTFAQRLAIQLKVNGLTPVTISLDDYFLDREHTPMDESGEYDFEALEAIDIRLFNRNLADLICEIEVEVPVFDFVKGCRRSEGRKLKIDDDHILVIEGIHGLNEKLTADIASEHKFKIYVSALTSISIDDHNRIPTTDTRIIRRMVRDFKYRGSSAVNTLKRWPSVRRGEDRNIFPFQEEADIMFNSSLVYELGVLKNLAEPLLADVDRSLPEYTEARRLLEFLSYFLPIKTTDIPLNSIIREFVGGSSFYKDQE